MLDFYFFASKDIPSHSDEYFSFKFILLCYPTFLLNAGIQPLHGQTVCLLHLAHSLLSPTNPTATLDDFNVYVALSNNLVQ